MSGLSPKIVIIYIYTIIIFGDNPLDDSELSYSSAHCHYLSQMELVMQAHSQTLSWGGFFFG